MGYLSSFVTLQNRSAGLKVVKATHQTTFPTEIFPVYMYALQANAADQEVLDVQASRSMEAADASDAAGGANAATAAAESAATAALFD